MEEQRKVKEEDKDDSDSISMLYPRIPRGWHSPSIPTLNFSTSKHKKMHAESSHGFSSSITSVSKSDSFNVKVIKTVTFEIQNS